MNNKLRPYIFGNGRVYPLSVGKNIVGRRPNVAGATCISLGTNDASLLDEHAVISVTKMFDGSFQTLIGSLSDKGRVYVNGKEVMTGTSMMLDIGSKIQLGNVNVVYTEYIPKPKPTHTQKPAPTPKPEKSTPVQPTPTAQQSSFNANGNAASHGTKKTGGYGHNFDPYTGKPINLRPQQPPTPPRPTPRLQPVKTEVPKQQPAPKPQPKPSPTPKPTPPPTPPPHPKPNKPKKKIEAWQVGEAAESVLDFFGGIIGFAFRGALWIAGIIFVLFLVFNLHDDGKAYDGVSGPLKFANMLITHPGRLWQEFKSGNTDAPQIEDRGSDLDSDLMNGVDLGLPSGTIWGDRNVGAESPKSVGSMFAFGSTVQVQGDSTPFDESNDPGKNFADGESIVGNPEYDPATSLLGKEWQMPSKAQMQELVTYCKFYVDRLGYKVIGPNGNSIFLPYNNGATEEELAKTRIGDYWTGEKSAYLEIQPSVLEDGKEDNNVKNFNKSLFDQALGMATYCCLSVRPVKATK